MRPADAGSLQEALERRAARHGGSEIGVLDRRGRLAGKRTLAETLAAAAGTGGRLARLGVEPGSPVLVALPTSFAWLDAWLGTLAAGGLPVAMAPSSPLGAGEESVRRATAVLDRLGARHLVCNRSLAARLRSPDAGSLAPSSPGLVVRTPEELESEPAGPLPRRPPTDPEETAFLQLTSGTTGESRAVRIPHRAILHHLGAIQEAMNEPLGLSPEEIERHTVVSWLPLYHDMGLVGCLLTGLLNGPRVRLLPPEAFLGRPRLWLELLGAAEGSVSAAPNFAYQFCVEQLTDTDLGDLDLSGWKSALVGAEMVRPETAAAFASRFAAHGYRPESLRPCYGLAEATLAVTIDRADAGLRTAEPAEGGRGAPAVCLGPPLADTEVEITAPDGTPLGEGRVGEIRVRGPGIFGGYYNDPEATAETLVDGTLRTGDLGFVAGGELYVTGRIKEIMVVRGQNLMPHELERLAESATGGGSCRAAAFSIDGGGRGEQIVLVAETGDREPATLRELDAEIRRKIGLTLGLPLADLLFVPTGKLPRTTSGKVPRGRLREDYVAGRLARLES